MSLPPLTLVPLDGAEQPVHVPAAGAVTGDEARREPFAWPTPSSTSYPPPTCPIEPEPCEIEGLNGRKTQGLLTFFDLAEGLLHLQLPSSRQPLPLRFTQFRRLTLILPLAPLATQPAAGDDPLAARPTLPYRIHLRNAPVQAGKTIGHKLETNGLFLFEPIDDTGRVRRSFVPRSAYDRADVGERLGDVLVAQKAASVEAIEQTAREQSELRAQKIGDVLLGRQVVTPQQLEIAIEQQARMPMVRIGEALKTLGFITQTQLESALQQQRVDRGKPLGELLVNKGIVSRPDLQAALARKMGYPLVDAAHFPIEPAALARVPVALARQLQALPLMLRSGRLIVALEDPTHAKVLGELEFASQTKVLPVLAQSSDLASVIERAYARVDAVPVAAADAIAFDDALDSLKLGL